MIDDYQKLKAKALRALARRDHSRHELEQKLTQSCDNREWIEKILEECEANNWLNEMRFAQIYLRSRAQRYYGPKKIRYELQQRGLTAEMIEQVITATDLDWAALAEEARQRKFGAAKPNSFAERGKQSQYLYQRGF